MWLLPALFAASFWSTALVELFSILAVVAGLFELTVRRRLTVRPTRSVSIILAVVAIYVLGVLLSLSTPQSSASPLVVIGKLWHVLLVPAAYVLCSHRQQTHRCARAFILSAAVAAIFTIVLSSVGTLQFLEHSFLGNTTTADLLALAGIVSVAAFLSSHGKTKTITMIVAMLIFTSLSVRTLRTPFAVLSMGGVLLLASFNMRYALSWAFASMFLIFFGPEILRLKFLWIINGNPTDRFVIWDLAINLLPSVPLFGYGPGSFPSIIQPKALSFINASPASWHNEFLQTIIESGWIAGIALAGLTVYILVTMFRSGLHPIDHEMKILTRTVTVVFVSCVMFSCVGLVASTAVLGTVWWTTVGISLSIIQKGYDGKS